VAAPLGEERPISAIGECSCSVTQPLFEDSYNKVMLLMALRRFLPLHGEEQGPQNVAKTTPTTRRAACGAGPEGRRAPS
jgi:hypothetical protein